jgi:hypothetical protein
VLEMMSDDATWWIKCSPDIHRYAFLTNSDFSCMAPKPSILQSIL